MEKAFFYMEGAESIEETIHVTFCDTNVVPSVVLEDDTDSAAEVEPSVSHNQGNLESQQAVLEFAPLNISTGDNSVLSPAIAVNPRADSSLNQRKVEIEAAPSNPS
ncbi:hypothetical protein PIB30_065028 [Stylosanthes scabra]|uniref:Uncharacterized protein n=1 Tax=Stylosanthes scabra TaxID=79078 RepID=A0ABU6ZKN9_9FABA|nr:hypothetical protein [Stylosanthes scabra]